MDNSPNPNWKKNKAKNLFKLVIKILITIFCFWYISIKIDFTNTWTSLLTANWWFLFVAVALYALSKIFSSFRLNMYFRNIRLYLPQITNGKLYWLGMFYNLFLPGAIGGDAYKVILLRRKLQAPYKKTSLAVLLDRFSGLLALGVLTAIFGSFVLTSTFYTFSIMAGSILSIVILYLIIFLFFKEFSSSFFPTFFWGIVVQLVQIGSIYFILMSLKLPLSPEWIFIFLISSVISVLPISMGGGLGTRELVFAEGAHFFHLNPATGVTISLLFFLCNLLSCVWGIYYVFHDPLENVSFTQNNESSIKSVAKQKGPG